MHTEILRDKDVDYSEVDHKKISNMYVCVYECKKENKCGRMLKIGDYKYESSLLQFWILKAF